REEMDRGVHRRAPARRGNDPGRGSRGLRGQLVRQAASSRSVARFQNGEIVRRGGSLGDESSSKLRQGCENSQSCFARFRRKKGGKTGSQACFGRHRLCNGCGRFTQNNL